MIRSNLISTGGTFALIGGTASAAELNLICSADVVICKTLTTAFEADHDIDVNMVWLSSGETYAKLRAEGRNPQTDIWWGGTGDPHLQAAQDGLRRSTNHRCWRSCSPER